MILAGIIVRRQVTTDGNIAFTVAIGTQLGCFTLAHAALLSGGSASGKSTIA
jgi:hypothetical protein